MSAKKIIAVLGATGAQGGGLVRSLLADPEGPFLARALTRDPDGAKAKALAARGAEVVRADLDDVDSLERAFRGAHGVYAVTNFWEHFSPERELSQAEHIAEAARRAGPEHVIWSTLEDSRTWIPLEDDRMPTLQGKYKVPHFDAKGEANHAFTARGVPVTFLLTSFYWDNLIHFGMGPKKGPDGTLAITFPLGAEKMAGIAAEDIGRCAHGIFKAGEKYIETTVGIAGGHLGGAEMAAALSRALGREVAYRDIPPEQYRALGFPGADDLGNMFQFYRDFSGYFGGSRSVEESRQLNPSLQSFEEWLEANKERIPLD